ncbi:DEAD/DEAH box helicase [Spirochaeta isovalerica]|uniref:ATP-dependent RNA helicase RhlE n=1 Tax=Spirochaeta isovalerica TaxID=150 RepID=A0A841R8D1_9SPIO|nr:DEAD/DEAH box helicase [Spirochaeta isovalerica]MBB6479447.1 ATP-dependent RNA helicase RhlE [Spirochaeta isovalerica]
MSNDKSMSAVFSDLKLSEELQRAVKAQEYDEPSPIQIETIPVVLSGWDILAASQTGTGKTAAYVLPLLDLLNKCGEARANHMKALVLAPTRELAAQIYESIVNYGRFMDLKSTVVYGGKKINPQMIRMTKGMHILVATPGRLLDLYRQNAVRFTDLKYLVLDEADRMLNLGFSEEIKEILNLLPRKRQTLMFTATFTDEVRSLARKLVNNPVEISVNPEEITVESVTQWVYPVDHLRKTALLIQLMGDISPEKVLVFTKTKNRADHLAQKLEKAGFSAAAIHGNKSQGNRTRSLEDFKNGKVTVLVATDLAARGLDINCLPLVVNFDLPHLKEDYIHRIGRTGRASSKGQAISFVSREEFKTLADIERLTKQVIDRITVPGFEMELPLPPSKLDMRPFKTRKPKKKKTELL